MNRISRRLALRGGAGVAIGLPLLEAMTSLSARSAHAAPPTRAKSVVIWLQPLSIYSDVFWPTAPGNKAYDWQIDPISEVYFSGSGTLDNADFEPPETLSFLAPHKKDLLFVEGLDNSSSNHDAYSTTLTGTATLAGSPPDVISIDQAIAKTIGTDTKFSALQVGVRNHGAVNKEAASWLSLAQAAPASDNPVQLWDRIFGDFATDPGTAMLLREQKRSVLDAALEQASTLRTSLGSADRQKLDQYLEAFRDVERRLDLVPQQACSPPARPSDRDDQGSLMFEDGQLLYEFTPICMKLQLELLAMALACDRTRVATFQFGQEAANDTFPWLGLPDFRWHDASHFENDDPAEWPQQLGPAGSWRSIAQWSVQQFCYLLERLKSLGAFDDSIMVFMTSMNHGGAHKSSNCPVLIAGNGGGALRTGRHVRYGHHRSGGAQARYFNDLHVTLANAAGVPMESFGEPSFNKGPLTELLT